MEYAPHQVVPYAGDVAGDFQRRLRRFADCVGERRIRRAGVEGGASRLEYGPVIQRQNLVPRLGERRRRLGGVRALPRRFRRPAARNAAGGGFSAVSRRLNGTQMRVKPRVEHDGGDDDQQGALGGVVPPRIFPYSPLAFRQIQMPARRRFCALLSRETATSRLADRDSAT